MTTGAPALAREDGRACRSPKRGELQPSSYLGPCSDSCSAVSSLKWLFTGGLRCKLRSHDRGARVTTTKRRKSTPAPLFWAGHLDLERTLGRGSALCRTGQTPGRSLHAFVATRLPTVLVVEDRAPPGPDRLWVGGAGCDVNHSARREGAGPLP